MNGVDIFENYTILPRGQDTDSLAHSDQSEAMVLQRTTGMSQVYMKANYIYQNVKIFIFPTARYFFTGCGTGLGISVLANNLLKDDPFSNPHLPFLLPIGAALTIIPLVGAYYLYTQEVPEYERMNMKRMYQADAVSAFLAGAVLGFKRNLKVEL